MISIPIRERYVSSAVIAHHGIHIDVGAQCCLFSAIACHQLSLTLRSHETRGDGIEVNAQFVPLLQGFLDIRSAFQNGVLAVWEGVADEAKKNKEKKEEKKR